MALYLQFHIPVHGVMQNSAQRQRNFTFYVTWEVFGDFELANLFVGTP
jgi:hypothetical protein